MKHPFAITLFMIGFFLLSQAIGLTALAQFIEPGTELETRELPPGIERPAIEQQATPWLLLGGILLGTALIFLLIRFKAHRAWSVWFFLAIFILSYITLSAFFAPWIALFGGMLFGLLKYSAERISWVLANIPELFIYGGFAILFSPLLSITGAIILLLLISAYDAFAVWRSKHMISLATFQIESGRFAGMNIPLAPGPMRVESAAAEPATAEPTGSDEHTAPARAILGGGDFAFPILVSGSALITFGAMAATFTTLGAAAGLSLLLFFSEKRRFYPAMPFISAGILIGLGFYALLF